MTGDPYDMAQALKDAGVSRAYCMWDPVEECVKTSHPVLEPMAQFLREDKVDFLKHEGLFFEVGKESKALMGAFLWQTARGQGCGGIRLRDYPTLEGYVRDGMRLAIGMGRKSALAGLWWGGGKGVIVRPPPGKQQGEAAEAEGRALLLRDYGRFVTSLRGAYVAAEDAGITVADMDVVFQHTRFTTCISPALGGSGNPSVPTAAGVVAAMEGALDFKGMGSLRGKIVAVQGLGNVGCPLVGFLLDKGVARVIAADSDPARVTQALSLYAGQPVEAAVAADGDDSILSQPAHILSPCAFGAVLNPHTVPTIQAQIVCGAANNQLSDPRDDSELAARGITYVPDFVANRMGIVNCANEQYGRVGRMGELADPAIAVHLGRDWSNSVFNITQQVLQRAQDSGVTPATAANQLADEAAAVPHPIWGHRTRAVLDSLVADNWAKGQ